MNPDEYKFIIIVQREALIQDLMPDIGETLLEKSVLSHKEYDSLKATYADVDEINFDIYATKLIDLIIEKPPSEIEKFVDSLKISYPWLYDKFPRHEHVHLLKDLIRGEVPSLPRLHVSRESQINELTNHLLNLKDGQNYLVLHGMPGSGKSLLAVECIQSKKVVSEFKDGVIWLNVYSTQKSQNHPNFATEMMMKVNHYLPNPVLCLTENEQKLHIRKQLEGKKCLLILDNVRSTVMVNALDFGVKTLIITTDKSIMDRTDNFYEVPSYFEEKEAMGLFAKSVSCPVQALPEEARSIFSITRGFPLHIGLLCTYLANHKEQFESPKSREWYKLWKYLLLKEERHLIPCSAGPVNYESIALVIESLDSNTRVLFEDWALFVEDINLKPEVLATVWNKSVIEAQNILSNFVMKSLLVRKWDNKSYVYGIHSCILSFLQRKLTKGDKKELHKKLLKGYRNKCPNGDFSKLPNDNYIFYYLGYHLKIAEEFDEFSITYLNLEFIEAKLFTAGPVDLFSDYVEYREFIVNNQESTSDPVREIQSFIQHGGMAMYSDKAERCKKPDIAQFIFQECKKDSWLYKKALVLAEKRSQEISTENYSILDNCSQIPSYIHLLLEPVEKKNHYEECILKHPVSVLQIINGQPLVLIGYKNGDIELYNISTKSSQCYYEKEESTVGGLSVNCDSRLFLSYANSKLSIWPLYIGTSRLPHSQDEPNGVWVPNKKVRAPIPGKVQKNHNPFHPGDSGNVIHRKYSLKLRSVVTSAVFSVSDPTLFGVILHSRVLKIFRNDTEQWSYNSDTLLKTIKCFQQNNEQCFIAGGDIILIVNTSEKGDITGARRYVERNPIESLFINTGSPHTIYLSHEDSLIAWNPETDFRERVWCKSKEGSSILAIDIAKYIVLAYSGIITVLDKESYQQLNYIHWPKCELKCLSADSERVLAVFNDVLLFSWELPAVSTLTEMNQTPIPSVPVALSAYRDHCFAVTGSNPPGNLLVWEKHNLLKTFNDVGTVQLVDISPDGQMIAYWQDHDIFRQVVSPNHQPPDCYSFLSYQNPCFVKVYGLADDYVILCGPTCGMLLCWNGDQQKLMGRKKGCLKDSFLIRDHVVCIDNYKGIEVHHVRKPSKKVLDLEGQVVVACVGGSYLAVGYRSKKLFLFDNTSLDTILEEDLPEMCHDASFTPDGSVLAVSLSSRQIMVMQVQTKTREFIYLPCCYISMEGKAKEVSLRLSGDGILCLRGDSCLCLVDIATCRRHASIVLSAPRLESRPPIIAAESLSPSGQSMSKFITFDSFCMMQEVRLMSAPESTCSSPNLSHFFSSS